MNAVAEKEQTGVIGSADVQKVEHAITEFNRVASGIAALRSQYEGVVYEVTTVQGMKDAKAARKAVAAPRIELEKIRKDAKAPILALGRTLDGEANRIKEELLAIETPIDEQIKTEEGRQEEARQAKIKAEQARVAEHQRCIEAMKLLAFAFTSAADPAAIAEQVTKLEGGLPRDYEEFEIEAETVRQGALTTLRAAHVEALERVEHERAQAERQAAEAARLAEERRQFEAQQVEARRNADIDQRIRALNGPSHLTASDSPILIEQAIETVKGSPITVENYGERLREAEHAKSDGILRLLKLHQAAIEHKAEQDRLETQRREQAQREQEQVERQRQIDEQARLVTQAREQREREQREAEERERAQQAEQERIARERQIMATRINALTVYDFIDILSAHMGYDREPLARRLAQIPRKDWLALADELKEKGTKK